MDIRDCITDCEFAHASWRNMGNRNKHDISLSKLVYSWTLNSGLRVFREDDFDKLGRFYVLEPAMWILEI